MSHFVKVDIEGIEPEVSTPDADRIIDGNPVHTAWNIEEKNGLYCGIWQSTPGTWRISYDEWEYCRILDGVSIITEDGGAAKTLRVGDSFILRPGFKGTWQVVETCRKDYVIKL